jgi:hypothetical protein
MQDILAVELPWNAPSDPTHPSPFPFRTILERQACHKLDTFGAIA